LQLGKQTCLFKYEERLDTTQVDVDSMHCKTVTTIINAATLESKSRFTKDTIILRKSLTLQDDGLNKTINTRSPWSVEIIDTINPLTHKEDTIIVTSSSAQYHVETEMSYFDFLLLLKTKFELKNPQKKLHVYSFKIYYETSDTSGLIEIKYPQTIEGVISKLNCLANGGFILLSLKADDHNLVNIDTGGAWLALIHIRK